jgi:DNA-binding transcriptional regulator LsrR (DeoR family)
MSDDNTDFGSLEAQIDRQTGLSQTDVRPDRDRSDRDAESADIDREQTQIKDGNIEKQQDLGGF